MIDAEVLATKPYSDSDDRAFQVYSIWFPRGADDARFTVEVVAQYQTKLSIDVCHKNRDEPGDGTPYGGAFFLFDDGVGRTTLEWQGLKEMVRFVLTVEASLGGGEPEVGTVGWVIFRFLQPAWFEAVKV